MQTTHSKLKKNIFLFLLTPILITAILIPLVIVGQKSATLNIDIAPLYATVSIDDKTYSNHSKVKLKPGNYSATISAPDFEPQSINFSLSRHENFDLRTYLLDSNSDLSYYETNSDDLYYLREYLHNHSDDELLSTFLTEYDKKRSVRNILPLYDIDQSTGESYYIFFETSLPTCNRLYCLQIGASSKTVFPTALAQLRSHGYNPDDYQIIYKSDH